MWCSLMQGQKSKSMIVVTTSNLATQLQNACAKGYLKLSNMEHMSVFCVRWSFCDQLEDKHRCLSELEKRSYSLHQDSRDLWWTLEKKYDDGQKRYDEGQYPLTATYANFSLKQVVPVRQIKWLKFFAVGLVQ